MELVLTDFFKLMPLRMNKMVAEGPTKSLQSLGVRKASRHTCVRALTLMRFLKEVDDEAGSSKYISENVISSMFLQKTDPRSQTYIDLAKNEWDTGGENNRVCNHFRKKQESNRIFYHIWEVTTDNLAFFPISLDFLLIGLGVLDALVESFKTTMSTNNAIYFVLVMGIANGKMAMVGGNSFIVVPSTPQKLCQQGKGRRNEAP